VLVDIQFGLSIRDLFWFGSRFLLFGTRLLRRFKVASVWFGLVQDSFSSVQRLLQFSSVWFKVISVVQGCFSGSRLLRQRKVMSVVQGGFASVRFKVICFGLRFLRFGSRFASTVQGHVGGSFGSFGFIWFNSCRCSSRQTTTSLSVGSFTLVRA
jgi:hypothetical protein